MSNHEVLRWYLHVDLDAFFASVEQLDNPELRGKPVIVGGLPEDRRSVVSTASYEARVFGVHSAMPTFQAYRLCPQGIFVRGRMHRYAELSHQIMNIFRDYSPDVDQMSIDEAFIDLTGTEKLFGLPEETARRNRSYSFHRACNYKISCKNRFRPVKTRRFLPYQTWRRTKFYVESSAF